MKDSTSDMKGGGKGKPDKEGGETAPMPARKAGRKKGRKMPRGGGRY